MLPTIGVPQAPKASNTNKTQSTKAPAAMPTVGPWDYKTAQKGPQGQELPKDAEGWTPEGNPYFGSGIKAKIKEYAYMFTKDIPQVDDSTWAQIKTKWKASVEKQKQIQANPNATPQEKLQADKEGFGVIGDVVKTAWQAGSAQGSLISPILRGVSVGVKAVGDLFNVPAVAVERGIGTIQGFQDAANAVDSPLPKMDSNWFTKIVEDTPIGMAYDFTRLALSPSQDKWQQAKTGIQEGWQSGRIAYSMMYDATIKEEFLRRYRAGENPELLAMELQNPLVELGGQLVLDPTNLISVWAKGAKAAHDLDKASDAIKATGIFADAEAVKALEMIGKTTNEAEAVKGWETIVNAQRKAIEAVEGGRILNNTFTKDALTQGSRVKLVQQTSSDFIGLLVTSMTKEGHGFDAVADAVRAGVYSVSKNADEMQQGLQALAHLPNSHLWMNDDALTTWTVIRNLVTNEEGAIDATKLFRLQDKKDLGSFAEAAGALIAQAAKSEFPDVQEMKAAAQLVKKAEKIGGTVSAKTKEMADVYDSLSPAVKALDEVNNIISKPKNWINSILSMDYFGLRGGTAVKNVATNMEFILLDKGASVWFKDVVTAEGKTKKAIWTLSQAKEYLQDVYGFDTAATKGFDTLTAAEGATKFKLPGSKIMEYGEAAASSRIVAAATRDTMNKLLRPGFALPTLDVLQNAGLTEKQASTYAKFMQNFNGNGEKALEAFRGLYGTGSAEEWRHLDFLTKTYDGALKEMGMYDDLTDFARTGGNTLEEVEAFFAGLRKQVIDRAGEAVKDMVGVSKDHPALDLLSHLDEEVKAGNLDAGRQEVFKAVMQASQNAKNEYMETLNSTIRLVTNRLSMNGKIDEATQLGKDYDEIFKSFLSGGNETRNITTDLLTSTRSWSAEIKKLKAPSAAELTAYWKRANLAGEPPVDITKQSLLSALWDQHRERVSGEWNTYFDTLFSQSEDMVKGLSKYMDATEIKSDFTRARYAVNQAQAYRAAVYEGGRLRINPQNDINWLAKQFGVATATAEGAPNGNRLLDTINKYLPEGTEKFSKVEDVPYDVAAQALERRRVEKGLPEVNLASQSIAVPPPATDTISFGRAWNENSKGTLYMLDDIKNKIVEKFGQRTTGKFDDGIEAALKDYNLQSADRINESRAIALKIATEQRNFTLLNYGERTYSDVAKSYIMPYHFFYTRQYKNLAMRIAQNPQIVAGYAKYKNFLENLHKELPDWYKQQLNVNPFAEGAILDKPGEMLGIRADHPLFINLEASLNPLYGLTGTDFNDPAKRGDWFSATVDDVGKFGPSLWAPIQMGMAAYYQHQGQADMASRWGSRLVPLTGEIKTASSFLPFLKKPVELDPSVNLFSGGMDAMERSRVGAQVVEWQNAQIAQIQNNPNMTRAEKDKAIGDIKAQANDIVYQQSGPIWDEAYKRAVQARGTTVLGGWLLGVGFKPRTDSDVMQEKMFTDLNKLYSVSDMMTKDQYRNAYDQLLSKYPGMEAALLARKGGDKRDAALAYNVFGRLPPGKLDDVLEAVGFTQQDINKFYESKGFTNPDVSWTPTEKQRFMATVVDLAAMLSVPPDATRQEWTAAKNAYLEAQNQIKVAYGDDIWDKVSHYYDLKDDSPQKADEFRTQHPEITQALTQLQQAKVMDPNMNAYYGGIEVIESYVSGQVRQQLTEKYGENIYDLQTEYFNRKVADANDAKRFLRQHPELRQFWNEKAGLDEQANRQFIQMGSKIPEGEGAGIRAEFQPESGAQEALMQAAMGDPAYSWDSLSERMSDQLKARVEKYWMNNEPLPKAAQDELDFVAKQMNFYNGDALLRRAGLSLYGSGYQPQGNPQQAAPANYLPRIGG